MKLFSEIIVIYDDIDMPSEEKFCPPFWQAEHFDSDGDFYTDGIGTNWTDLDLTKIYADGSRSEFELDVYREKNRMFEPAIQETVDLARYVDYKAEGRYSYLPKINDAKNLCVASLSIKTESIEDYRIYLETVHFFLAHTDGIAANFYNLDANAFYQEFLGDSRR